MKNPSFLQKQFLLTPAAGKRLIARALAVMPLIVDAMRNRTVVVIAGTTNGYVAEELLKVIGQEQGFSRRRFFRGITLPPGFALDQRGRLPDEGQFPGDVVICRGTWDRGKTIGDVVDGLDAGDLILKGANAVNPERGQAAILIGHEKGGTINLALQAVIGRRVGLILPVGLEKRVSADLLAVAERMNAVGTMGYRYHVVGGTIITELEAIRILTGAEAELVAAGGVGGAEGSCWIAVSGSAAVMAAAEKQLQGFAGEPAFLAT